VEDFTPYTLNFSASCPTEIECSAPAKTSVYLNACGDDPANGSGIVNVTVRAMDTNSYVGNSILVTTGITVYVEATGADSGTIGGYINISQGDYCGTGTISGFDPNEIIDSYSVISVLPVSTDTQDFITGSGFRNTCWSCNNELT